MTSHPVADQAHRDRLRLELDRTLLVEAGAGTGKTTAVVSRIVALVAAGRLTMERLVAITFTVAAAGELRVRVREELERAARQSTDERECAALRAAAGEVARARIETIHAFCSALLRMHPLEAGLPPDFDTIADLAAAIDVRERFRRWFDELAPGAPGSDAVRRALLLGLRPNRMLDLFTTLNDNWDLVATAGWAADTAPVLGEVRALGDDVASCVGLLDACRRHDALYEGVGAMRIVAARLGGATTEHEALAALVALDRSPRLGNAGSRGNWTDTDGGNACLTIRATLKDVHARASQLLLGARADALGGVAAALRDVVAAYAEERRSRGAVSYQDLLVRARDLVRDHADVRAALRGRWDLVAVDEFQDTDPLQAELALRLCAAVDDRSAAWHELTPTTGRLCVVGDPKQSIYRFRRADIAMYRAVERSLVAGDPARRVPLSVNFRSGRRIIEAVNAVFGGTGGLMPGDGTDGVQATYVDLVAHDPEFEGTVRVFGDAVDAPAAEMWRCEAREAAAVVRSILDEPWTVDHGRAGGPRACAPQDVCILMPSRTNLRNLERALEAARVRYRLESGSLIVATQEVRDLLNILRTLDDPTDEVALVAALRTPAFGCSDPELARWRSEGGSWSYERPGDGAETRVLAGLAELRRLHGLRHTMTVPRLVDEVLSSRLLRAAAFDDWRPRETLRRYRFVSDQARALARSGRPTLHDAVDYLERLARDPTYDSVAEGDPDDEACVRVMTVHAAKGLEFPVVVVTGLGRRVWPSRPLLVTDPVTRRVELRVGRDFQTPGWDAQEKREARMDAAERVRLLYVALTRARDHLVVGVFRAATKGEETDAGRLHTLLSRLTYVERMGVGLHAAVPGDAGERGAGADTAPADAEAHRRAEDDWLRRRNAVLATLSSTATATATALAHAGDESGMPPGHGDDAAASRRGRAATSVGRAVHAVLQVVDLSTGADVDALSRAQAAAEGIPERAVEVAELARAALASAPVRAAAALRHWREVPFGAPVDGVVVEGFVDLLYELPDGRLVVVDHKTDAVRGASIDARMEDYAVQGGVYALLVAETTGRQVARIEFVFAAAEVTRTITDVAGAVAEVRAALGGRGRAVRP